MDLRLSKSHARQTKCQIMINYDWDRKEANFADSASTFVKDIFLKYGWMASCHLYRGK